jgi:hypothetical protein
VNPGISGSIEEGITVSTVEKVKHEIVSVAVLMLYFLTWLGFLMLLKYLLLADYEIQFSGISKAVVGALVLAKVVLVLEYVPLGKWVRSQAAWVDVILRTGMYTAGVFVVMVLEKAFEGRQEHGGFMEAMNALFTQVDIYHLWLNLICVSAALLSYNIISVLHKNLGKGVLLRMLLSPTPAEPVQLQIENT